MFNRNELVHAVIWPAAGTTASIALIDTDGVIQSEVLVHEPIKGSELHKMIPEGFMLDPGECTVVNMSGKILVSTVGEFDTAVVTERAEISFEERMQRLERRDRRRAEAERRRQAEHEEQMAELRAQMEAEEAEANAELEIATEEETVEQEEPATETKEEASNA